MSQEPTPPLPTPWDGQMAVGGWWYVHMHTPPHHHPPHEMTKLIWSSQTFKYSMNRFYLKFL